MPRAWVLVVLLTSFASCTYPRIDLEGRRCPCVAGWVCGPGERCVPEGDASVFDVPRVDAPPTDTSEPDVLATDAPLTDAGSTDAVGLDTPPSTDAGGCHDQTLELTATSEDGAYEPPDMWNPDGVGFFLQCGRNETSEASQWCYFRFALREDVPAAVTDLHVFLELAAAGTTGSWNSTEPRYHLTVQFENVSEPAVVTSLSSTDVVARVSTLSSAIRWPAAGALMWAASGYQRSPDLAVPLQELLTANGPLSARAHVQLWVQGGAFADLFTASVRTPAAGGTGMTANPARLLIHWCDPP